MGFSSGGGGKNAGISSILKRKPTMILTDTPRSQLPDTFINGRLSPTGYNIRTR